MYISSVSTSIKPFKVVTTYSNFTKAIFCPNFEVAGVIRNKKVKSKYFNVFF